MLSPTERQVAHVLLTRSPLSWTLFHPKTSEKTAPFDLHVLGAPPAFVLSQDQTLYNMVLIRSRVLTKVKKFIRSSRITNVLLVRMSLSWHPKKFTRVCTCLALFNFQGPVLPLKLFYYITLPSLCQHLFLTFPIRKSYLWFQPLQTVALLSYHIFAPLSTLFLQGFQNGRWFFWEMTQSFGQLVYIITSFLLRQYLFSTFFSHHPFFSLGYHFWITDPI